MECQTRNAPSICIQALINDITLYLSGNICKNISVIKVSNDNLPANGELYFLPSLKVWRSILHDRGPCDGKCATILQHFLHMHGRDTGDRTDTDVAKEVLQLLISSSSNWPVKLERYTLGNERVCLFLQRLPLTANSIETVIARKRNFGKALPIDKVFHFKIDEDKESELTTRRLRLIKNVTEKLLSLHGCQTSEEESSFKFLFTTKSQGIAKENYSKCVCGVVKNSKSNTKETKLTWKEHIGSKVLELKELNEQKYFETQERDVTVEDQSLENVARATATFELLSLKPSRSVFIGRNSATDRSTTNTKGASFVLYNTARIAAIIEKYNDKKSAGEYPSLPSIDDVNFALLDQEEEWELIYNFVIGYPEMIKSCLKCEPRFQTNPQVICIFLSRLCQKFSIYYRRTRILTEAYDHLIPTMVARLYMLHALQIIFENALALLDIVPTTRM